MKMMDCVEVVVEKENYAVEGGKLKVPEVFFR